MKIMLDAQCLVSSWNSLCINIRQHGFVDWLLDQSIIASADERPVFLVSTKSGKQKVTSLLSKYLRKVVGLTNDQAARICELAKGYFGASWQVDVTISNSYADKALIGEGVLESGATCFASRSVVNSFCKEYIAGTPSWYLLDLKDESCAARSRALATYLGMGRFLLCNFYVVGISVIDSQRAFLEALRRSFGASTATYRVLDNGKSDSEECWTAEPDFTEVKSVIETFYFNGDGRVVTLDTWPEELDQEFLRRWCPVCQRHYDASEAVLKVDGNSRLVICRECYRNLDGSWPWCELTRERFTFEDYRKSNCFGRLGAGECGGCHLALLEESCHYCGRELYRRGGVPYSFLRIDGETYPVCEECFQGLQIVFCGTCRSALPMAEALMGHNEYYCPSCHPRHVGECDSCGMYARMETLTSVGEVLLCPHCLPRYA